MAPEDVATGNVETRQTEVATSNVEIRQDDGPVLGDLRLDQTGVTMEEGSSDEGTEQNGGVAQGGASQSIETTRLSKLKAVRHGRSAASEASVEVVYPAPGPLGLIFGCSEDHMPAWVDSVDPDGATAQLCINMWPGVSAGMVLTHVQGQLAGGYAEALKAIKSSSRPVTLRFRTPDQNQAKMKERAEQSWESQEKTDAKREEARTKATKIEQRKLDKLIQKSSAGASPPSATTLPPQTGGLVKNRWRSAAKQSMANAKAQKMLVRSDHRICFPRCRLFPSLPC